MFVTFGAAGRSAAVYGVTTSSLLVVITVYCTPGTVSPPALSAVRKDEPASCSTQASQGPLRNWFTGTSTPNNVPSVVSSSSVVPLLLGESPTSLSTLAAPPRFLM